MRTDGDIIETEIEYHRRLRRDAQRKRRAAEADSDRQSQRRGDSEFRRVAWAALPESQRTEIRCADTASHARHHSAQTAPSVHATNEKWWDQVAILNTHEIAKPLSLLWNRCGLNVRNQILEFKKLFPHRDFQALTGERIHDKCFICGPKGTHYQPLLPPYPQEWDYFLDDRKTASISRKLNNIFSLTTIGDYDGDFMKFPNGVVAVTLAGSRTYHQMLPAHEGQHVIHWFIHDPWAMFWKGTEMNIPHDWINSTLAGLERVNPFKAELEKLNVYDDDDDIALHIEHSDSSSNETAAIISLAPAAAPSRRKLVIQLKGNDEPVFLDLLSPLVEPLHYLLLLPHGTLGWSPSRRTTDGKNFSQMRWY
ncbi:hypothetical protein B0H10DRAFT_1952581 [Mycena sp. CBHHK59/15]|nr:hypothetical protein B0H10DRAFT_1952581 [Mycena sp. CBHHK59/15]